jgi:hypothetical protein
MTGNIMKRLNMRFASIAMILFVLASVLSAQMGASFTVAQSLAQTEDAEALMSRLQAVPLFSNFDTDRVFDIFEWGQQVFKRPNVFTTVGDSNTTNGDFLRPLGMRSGGCDLGAYASLQETVDFFSAEPVGDNGNSFTNDSIAADRGFSSATVLDPFWADPNICLRNESPLLCEYRVARPSIAVIMLGQIDINYGGLSVEDYHANMERIVQQSIGEGVIPVLTTIVFLPERDVWKKSMDYNMALLDIAEHYQTPLINLWAAAQSLPNVGIGPDRSHLAARVGSFCSFTGAEQELGGTLRNLLTLQALDELRRAVIASP